MCLSCGCGMPDEDHGDKRYLTMRHLVDAAKADKATVEQTWKNIVDSMEGMLSGKLKSKIWKPKK